MDKETKTFIATIAIALAILWIFKPKKSANATDKESDVVVTAGHYLKAAERICRPNPDVAQIIYD